MSLFKYFFTPLNEQHKKNTFDIIRGLAVLLVLFAHLDNFKLLILWPFSYQPLQGFIGQIGVDLFFLLSGYLILSSASQSLNQPRGLFKYAINRITRIYPLYIISIILIIIFAGYFIGYRKPEISFDVIARHLIFAQSFSPFIAHKLNGPFWSLTHEFMFYLLVPVLYFLKPSYWMMLCSILITQLLVHFSDNLHAFINYWSLFAIGILIYQCKHTINKWVGIFLLLIVCVLCIEFAKVKILEFLFASLLFSTLLNFDFKRLVFKPLVGLGIISYSVYIWHYVIIHLVSPYVRDVHMLLTPINPWLPFGFAFEALLIIVFILLFSCLSYYLVEKPCMTTLRKKLIEKIEAQ